MDIKLIAPCGMNCNICLGYLREKKKCPGCNNMDENKPESCRKCIIRNCPEIKKSKVKFCYICKKYPCTRLKRLDKRYQTKYNMSMLDNLNNIKENGIRKFTKEQKEKYKCPTCNSYICIHRGYCIKCKK